MPTKPLSRLAILVLAAEALASCLTNGARGRGGRGGAGDGGEALAGFDSGICLASSCPRLGCGPGTRAVPLSGECCPTVCESTDCSLVDCPALACPAGTHLSTSSAMCCATCVKNPPPKTGETCEQGQAGYGAFLDQTMANLGAAFCNVDGDCRIVTLDNPCNHDCGTAVAARSSADLRSQLQGYAALHCAACDPVGPGCPPVERFAYCTGGVCSAH